MEQTKTTTNLLYVIGGGILLFAAYKFFKKSKKSRRKEKEQEQANTDTQTNTDVINTPPPPGCGGITCKTGGCPAGYVKDSFGNCVKSMVDDSFNTKLNTDLTDLTDSGSEYDAYAVYDYKDYDGNVTSIQHYYVCNDNRVVGTSVDVNKRYFICNDNSFQEIENNSFARIAPCFGKSGVQREATLMEIVTQKGVCSTYGGIKRKARKSDVSNRNSISKANAQSGSISKTNAQSGGRITKSPFGFGSSYNDSSYNDYNFNKYV